MERARERGRERELEIGRWWSGERQTERLEVDREGQTAQTGEN